MKKLSANADKITVLLFGCDRVGDAVRAWCLETHSSRRDVFVTTKIIFPKETQMQTLESLRESVNKVNLDGKLTWAISPFQRW